MKVNFVNAGVVGFASYRYHNLLPSKFLTRLGHVSAVTKAPIPEFDVYIFSKHHDYAEHDTINQCKKWGKTVFHCCDNHFQTKHKQHYKNMISRADYVITTTKEMQKVIKEETGKDAVLIPDTVEWNEETPAYCRQGKLRLLWYGHISNLFGMAEIIDKLDAYKLKVCTLIPKDSEIQMSPNLYVPFDFPSMKMCFEWCDAVIIPVREGDRRKVKSHNRLSEAVRNGKFVIASPMEAYKEFSEWMYIGDVLEGIKWLDTQGPATITKRIGQAQDHINANYSQEKVGHLWEQTLKKFCSI